MRNDIRAAELFSSLNYKKGTLRFGLPPSAGSVYFSRVLYLYSKEYDHVDLQIFEEKSKKIEEMVLNDKLDLGVVVEPFHNPKLELKTVFRSEAVLAVSKDHRFADRKEIDFAALKEEPMLAVSKDYMYYDQVILYCRTSFSTVLSGISCWKWRRKTRGSPLLESRLWKRCTASG